MYSEEGRTMEKLMVAEVGSIVSYMVRGFQ